MSRGRYVAGIEEQAASSKQVQVLLRPTGDFFCFTQFQNQYPELDPALRPSPVSFLEPHWGGRGIPRGACACRGCAALSGARRPAHGHA